MNSSLRAAYRYGNIGLELVLSVVVGFLLGRWVDRHLLHGHGWGTGVGTVIGVYAGFRSMWKLAKRAQAEAEAEEAADRKKAEVDAKVAKYKKAADEEKP